MYLLICDFCEQEMECDSKAMVCPHCGHIAKIKPVREEIEIELDEDLQEEEM
jgi:rRNA maturation endonuclease Nob1